MKSKRHFYFLISLSFILSFPSIPSFFSLELPKQTAVLAAEDTKTTKIKQLARANTVRVQVGDGLASGVLIAKAGQTYTVVTNAHVVNRGDSYRIQTSDGKIHSAKLQYQGESFAKDDLALLQFQTADTYSIANLGNSATLSKNQNVFVVGFPYESEELSISNSKISLVAEKPLVGGYQIGFGSETKQGMSGGALLNDKGELIGILGQGNMAVIDDAYTYQDGSRPSAQTREQMRFSSFAIPISRVGRAIATKIVNQVDKVAQQITVRIDSTKHGNGSGAIIAKKGNTYYVLTAAHVVKNSDKYELTTPDGEKYQIDNRAIEIFEKVDLAVVPFISQKTYQIATFADYTPIWGAGESMVFLSGFPKDNSSERKLTAGYGFPTSGASLTAYNAYSLTNGYELVYSNFSQPGMSGAPVLDSLGRVVGINAATEAEVTIDDRGQQIEMALGRSLGVPIKTFLGLASQANLDPKSLKIDKNAVRGSFGGFLGTIGSIYTILSSFDVPTPAKETNAIAWLNYGNQLWRLHRHKEAIAAFEKAIQLKPDFDRAYHAKGLALYTQYNWQQALAAFEQATQINPSSAESWRMQTESLYVMQKYPEALAASDKAIQLNPTDSVVLMQRGFVLMSLQRIPEAVEALTQSIELQPNPWSYTMRGTLRITLGDRQGSVADLKRALELDPNFLLAYMSLGGIYSAIGDNEAALATFDKAVELTSQLSGSPLIEGSMLSMRGMFRAKSGDYQGAIDDYNQAIAKLAEDKNTPLYMSSINIDAPYGKTEGFDGLASSIYIQRAVAYAQLGNAQNAIADLNRAIETQPTNAEAYLIRGSFYVELKEKEKAIADLNRAAQLYQEQGNMQGYQQVQQLLKKVN
jgi:tetratricopeptide (TPR) repeat protein